MQSIETFERGIFKHFISDSDSDSDYGPAKLKQNFEESVRERVKLRKQKTNKKLTIEDLNKIVDKNNNNIRKETFSNYFVFSTLTSLEKTLICFQKNEKDTYEKYKDKIEDGIEKLKIDKRRQTNKESIKKIDDTIEAIEMIVEYTEQQKPDDDKTNEVDKQPDTTDMPDLEREKDAAERREKSGKRLKILAPQEMLSRPPITLAQLKAGNNSEKLKKEIRQLLYSLYRSKKLSKKIYKNLIKAI